MGKSTWDVAALLTQMTQHRIDYTQDIMASKHCTIGVIRAPFTHMDEENKTLFDSAIKALGPCIKLDPCNVPGIDELFVNLGQSGWHDGKWIGSVEDLVVKTEVYESINHHLAGLTNCQVKNMEEMVAWNRAHPVSF